MRLVQEINSFLSAFHASPPSFFGDRLGWHPSDRFHFGLLPRFFGKDFPLFDLPWPCLRLFVLRLFGQTWNLPFVKGLFVLDFVGFAADLADSVGPVVDRIVPAGSGPGTAIDFVDYSAGSADCSVGFVAVADPDAVEL